VKADDSVGRQLVDYNAFGEFPLRYSTQRRLTAKKSGWKLLSTTRIVTCVRAPEISEQRASTGADLFSPASRRLK
jgi:hypothetical protein